MRKLVWPTSQCSIFVCSNVLIFHLICVSSDLGCLDYIYLVLICHQFLPLLVSALLIFNVKSSNGQPPKMYAYAFKKGNDSVWPSKMIWFLESQAMGALKHQMEVTTVLLFNGQVSYYEITQNTPYVFPGLIISYG